jgi:hypothetical protein
MLPAEAGDGFAIRLTNDGDVAALRVRLEDERELGREGYVLFQDSDFDLLPGESRIVQGCFAGVPAGERRASLRGWNTERIRIG